MPRCLAAPPPRAPGSARTPTLWPLSRSTAATGNIATKSLTVDAEADLHGTAGLHTGVARAVLNVNAANGAVTIGGPLLVTGDVVSAGKFGGNASGIGSAIIHGGDGVTLGNATVLGSASAVGGGLGQNANALASLKIKAETGNITGKSLTVVADAIASWVRRPGGRHGQGLVLPRRRHRQCHHHRR